MSTDHFHSGDRDLQGLNVNECGHLLCFCYRVLVNAVNMLRLQRFDSSENIRCFHSATDYLMED